MFAECIVVIIPWKNPGKLILVLFSSCLRRTSSRYGSDQALNSNGGPFAVDSVIDVSYRHFARHCKDS